MSTALALWTREKQFVVESGSGHAIVMDTGTGVGGRNTGPTPMELVLMGLAGCTGIDVVFILRDRMKKPLTGVEVRVSGERADTAPKVYTQLDVTYLLRGPGLPEKDALRAIRLSAEKYCSISVMLAKTAAISWRYEITDETTGAIASGTLEGIAH
jgi:putative redox protein